MPKIQQLSPHVADLIAAGEVVDRPAGAAKELVENAIDAGAKNITVEIQNGGMTFLRVTDDGCGMSAEDAPTAFLRHATSKLREASDLEAIHTLGFRGEALAAISAVSRVDLMTKTADAEFGTGLHLDAGIVTEQGDVGCPNGTTIIVRDLFYNTPARMKFMKRDTVEASALLSMVQRLALAHPEVAFRVLRDGEEQLHTAGDGRLYSAVYAVMGRTTAQEMTEVDSRYEKYALTGYVSKPNASRGNRSNQIFFVNGRHVRSKSMTAALEEAYRNALMVGRYPSCVLHLTMPEHLVDVNVHPAKTEVRFLNERDVFDCIRYGVQGALERASGRVPLQLPHSEKPRTQTTAVPKQNFFRRMSAEDYRAVAAVMQDSARADKLAYDTVGADIIRPRRVEGTAETEKIATAAAQSRNDNVGQGHVPAGAETTDCVQTCSPVPSAASRTAGTCPQTTVGDDTVGADIIRPRDTEEGTGTDKIATAQAPRNDGVGSKAPAAEDDGACTGASGMPQATASQETEIQQELPLQTQSYRVVGEVLDTYIIVEQDRQVLLIDKHAAHERILFEKLRRSSEPIMSQLLLEPILCQPEREEAAILIENAALLNECGFEVSDYGDGTLAVRRVPAELDPADAESALNQLASDLLSGKRTDPAALRDTMLHTVACKAAIKGGRHTDARERESLVKQVLSDPSLKYCPHGRPIVAVLTASQLERSFKRA
ncbi:MAG: DNA mismatch repair endonuclease MutL [Faecousia sp.]